MRLFLREKILIQIRIGVDKELEIGATYNVKIHLPEDNVPINFIGKVVRCVEVAEDADNRGNLSSSYMVGMQFNDKIQIKKSIN